MAEQYTSDTERQIATILRQADSDHAGKIIDFIDVTGLGLSKTAAAVIELGRKGFTFTKNECLTSLQGALIVLTLCGHWDRVFAVVDLVSQVPLMNWGQFEGLRMIRQDAWWYAARNELDDELAMVCAGLFDDDYKPLFLDIDGPLFKHPLEDPEMRQLMGLDESTIGYVIPPVASVGLLLGDLSLLSTIWAYGGSPVWPLDRIEAERERLEAGLLALLGRAGGTRTLNETID